MSITDTPRSGHVYTVAHFAIGTSCFGSYSAEKGETLQYSPESSRSFQFGPAQIVSAWLSISFMAILPGLLVSFGWCRLGPVVQCELEISARAECASLASAVQVLLEHCAVISETTELLAETLFPLLLSVELPLLLLLFSTTLLAVRLVLLLF